MSIGHTHPASGIRTRLEEPDDAPAIRRVVQSAYKREFEATIVDRLRQAGAVAFSMVAVLGAEEVEPVDDGDAAAADCDAPAAGHLRVAGGLVIGHALMSPATVIGTSGDVSLLVLGPVAVLPEHQGQGVGTLLVETCLERSREAGPAGVAVVGNPAYFSRFGFIQGSRWGLRPEAQVHGDEFMVIELSPGKLAGISGIVRYRPEFSAGASL